MVSASDIKTICTGLLWCVAVTASGEQKTISQDRVSLAYETAAFSKVEIVELKQEPMPHPHDQLNVHPANLLFLFYVGSQYAGSIELYPLEDRKAAYPELPQRGAALVRLVQYAQDTSEYAVGSRLRYQIEGLTTEVRR